MFKYKLAFVSVPSTKVAVLCWYYADIKWFLIYHNHLLLISPYNAANVIATGMYIIPYQPTHDMPINKANHPLMQVMQPKGFLIVENILKI